MSENWSVEHEAGFAEYEARQEYEAWLAKVDASIPLEEPEEESMERAPEDFIREWEESHDEDYSEDDCPLDGDAESALASCGWGTDEDYGYWGDE